MDINRVLSAYPKQRPSLNRAEQERYQDEYLISREGTTFATRLAQKAEGWMHRKVTRGAAASTLELGAGTLNHILYEKGIEASSVYDIVEPQKYLYEGSELLRYIDSVFSDIRQVKGESCYERIISIAVLEHVCDLPALIARSGLLLTEDGEFCNAIPSEKGLLWEVSWRVTTGLAYRIRTGRPYINIMRHEHVNTIFEIEALIGYFFRSVRVMRYPFPFRHLSLFTCISAKSANKDLCKEYLRGLQEGTPAGP